MKRIRPLWFAPLLFACLSAFPAAETNKLPGPDELAQAQARGVSIRDQKAVVPEALMKSAVVLKAGGVRCGHALVKIEDAQGDGGAVYRLVERLKFCTPQGSEVEVVEYTGSLLLAADLALLSGKQISSRTVSSGKATQSETITADVSAGGDELSWTRKEQIADDKPLETKSEPVKLHGVRPIPRNALIALAALASKQQGFKPGVFSPFLVPSMDMQWTIETFMLQPAWISFDLPRDKTNPAANMLMTVRLLSGEIGDKGLKTEPPGVDVWDDEMVWTFDDKLHVTGQPSKGDALVDTETADADQLDVNAPIDFDKLKTAVKEIEEKQRKEVERITKVPLK